MSFLFLRTAKSYFSVYVLDNEKYKLESFEILNNVAKENQV